MAQLEVRQKMRYSPQECSLIKSTFAEQEDVLVLIRKFFLQGDISKEQMGLLKNYFSNPEIMAVLRKAISPVMDKMAPPHQTVDLFTHMDLNPTPLDHANLAIKARWKAKTYLDQRFDVAMGKKVKNEIMFDDLIVPTEDKEETYTNFIARNFLAPHIDSQLFHSILIIAGMKEETPAEQQKRLTQNSSK